MIFIKYGMIVHIYLYHNLFACMLYVLITKLTTLYTTSFCNINIKGNPVELIFKSFLYKTVLKTLVIGKQM